MSYVSCVSTLCDYDRGQFIIVWSNSWDKVAAVVSISSKARSSSLFQESFIVSIRFHCASVQTKPCKLSQLHKSGFMWPSGQCRPGSQKQYVQTIHGIIFSFFAPNLGPNIVPFTFLAPLVQEFVVGPSSPRWPPPTLCLSSWYMSIAGVVCVCVCPHDIWLLPLLSVSVSVLIIYVCCLCLCLCLSSLLITYASLFPLQTETTENNPPLLLDNECAKNKDKKRKTERTAIDVETKALWQKN